MKGLGAKGKEELAGLGEGGARDTLWVVCVHPAKKGRTPGQAGQRHKSEASRHDGTRAFMVK